MNQHLPRPALHNLTRPMNVYAYDQRPVQQLLQLQLQRVSAALQRCDCSRNGRCVGVRRRRLCRRCDAIWPDEAALQRLRLPAPTIGDEFFGVPQSLFAQLQLTVQTPRLCDCKHVHHTVDTSDNTYSTHTGAVQRTRQ